MLCVVLWLRLWRQDTQSCQCWVGATSSDQHPQDPNVAGSDGGPGWGFFGMNGSHGMNGDGRARANAGDDVGFLNNFFARNDDASAALRRQMDSVGVACADARASTRAAGARAYRGSRVALAATSAPAASHASRNDSSLSPRRASSSVAFNRTIDFSTVSGATRLRIARVSRATHATLPTWGGGGGATVDVSSSPVFRRARQPARE